jgi:hypothetical protein
MCERIENALADLSNNPPLYYQEFTQRNGNILAAVQARPAGSDLSDLNSKLDALINELKSADDGAGGKILNLDRWERFFGDIPRP